MSLAFYFFLVCYKQLAAPIGQDLSCYPSTIDVLPSQCLSYSTALFLNLCILGQYSHLPYKIYIYTPGFGYKVHGFVLLKLTIYPK